jgi:hypothetical protein
MRFPVALQEKLDFLFWNSTEAQKGRQSVAVRKSWALEPDLCFSPELLYLFIFLMALGFELLASHLLGRCSYHLSHSASFFFVMVFLK